MKADETAIRKLVTDWMEASKSGDVDQIASLMTDDVVFLTPGAAPFGKSDFLSNVERMKNMRLDPSARIEEIQILGDWAWMRNHLEVEITMPGAPPKRRAGYTLTILRKQANGNWAITRDANLMS